MTGKPSSTTRTSDIRLGFVNQQGQQNGVDSLVVTDLISLARNRALADAVLLTGDEDLRVGVQQAQEYGVRVHLVGISPARENQSGFLVEEADSVRELTLAEVSSFLGRADRQSDLPVPAGATRRAEAPLEAAAQRVARNLSRDEREAVLKEAAGGSIPA